MDKLDNLEKMVAHIHGSKPSASETLSTRDMTTLDDLSYNFTDDPAITRAFLEKFGQVVYKGVRYTV
jgi:hypothetical protein